LSHFQRLEDYYQELYSVLGSESMLSLIYEEDIEEDSMRAYRKICNFLSIDAVEVRVKLQKIDPFKMRDYIVNYEEIKSLLTNTKYEWMLAE